MGKIKVQKQTVKFKVGKRLSKGDNITNTSFKTKKIKISGHRSFSDITESKQFILHLLKNLKKDTKSMKLHKLKKVQSLISSENEGILGNLNQIFNKVAGLILDGESSEVRKQTIRILQLIIKKQPRVSHPVHYTYIKSLVRSAMTDINVDVRYDSLTALRFILDQLPELVTKSHSLLNTLLCLISTRSKLGSTSHPSSSKSLISPGEKTGTLEFKKSVLKCLADFLRANIIVPEQAKFEKVTNINITNQKTEYTLIGHYDSNDNLPKRCFLGDHNEINFNYNLEEFQRFIDDLLPILYDNWVEFSPSPYSMKIGMAVTYTQSEGMLYILQIIFYLGEWLKLLTYEKKCKKLFDYKSGKKLLTKIFSKFPYLDEVIHGSLILKFNLTLCEIYSHIVIKELPSLFDTVLFFLFEQLCLITGKETEILEPILQILQDMLCHEENVSKCESHLEKLYNFYCDLQQSNECHKKIKNFFTKLSLDLDNFHHLHDNIALRSWWVLLPSEFINLASETFNETNQKFFEDLLPICQYDSEFIKTLSDYIDCIIPLIQSSNNVVSLTAVSFVAKLRPINKEHFILITLSLRDRNVPVDIIEILLTAFVNRSQTKNPGFSLADLLCFIVNLAFGPPLNEEELPESSVFQDLVNCIPFNLSAYMIIPDITKSHKDIANFAISQLCVIPDQGLVHSFIEQYMHILLQKSAVISINSAIVALKFASRFLYSLSTMFSDDILLQLNDLTTGCYLFVIAARTACDVDKELEIDWQAILTDLRQYTCDVGSVFKVILNASPILINPNYLFCMGQLLIQAVRAAVFRPEDINDLCAVLKTLKAMHGKKVTEQKWWGHMMKFLQLISN